MLNALIAINRALTRSRPQPETQPRAAQGCSSGFRRRSSRAARGRSIHRAGDASQFFHDLGIPIYNGYGCTEACTAITLNDLKPFRPDTVGRPVRGMEIRMLNPDAEGIGEVVVRSKTVMSGYLDDPEMTAETIVDGWLMTGDLGRIDATRPLAAFRPQEKHDRHRGREKYLSRGHRGASSRASP